jgi:tetratricopeptide (TPR) repeat protein
MSPSGYHLTSLVIHVVNAALLYFLARRLLERTGIAAGDHGALMLAAAISALVFAVHPLRVESVVWVTERRDVLSLLFYLSSILAYLRASDAGERHRHWYWPSVALFVCALLSKATAMTLPAVLFILDMYPLRCLPASDGWWSARARRVYVGLMPFAILSVASILVSIVALHPADQLSIGGKIAVSAYSLTFYLWKTFVPLRLSPLYEMPQQVHPFAPVFIVSYIVAIVLTGLAWRYRHRWPGLTTAWFAFVAISLPMLGIVQNGPQIAADRYTYHAAPVLAVLAGEGFYLALHRGHGDAVRVLATILVIGLSTLTWKQTKVWRNSETLWAQVLSLDPSSSYAHSAWASVLYQQDRVDEALDESRQAVALAPALPEARNNLGVGLARQGRLAEAIEQYHRAIDIKPAYDEAQNNWGVVLARQGDLNAAVEHYSQALAANPLYADAHVNWGNALVRLGTHDEAIAHYRAALGIRPDHAEAQFNWGVALAREGKLAGAIEHFGLALAINPRHAEASAYLHRARQMLP